MVIYLKLNVFKAFLALNFIFFVIGPTDPLNSFEKNSILLL